MHRLLLLLSLPLILAVNSRAQSLTPPSPEPYNPYLSELMLMRLFDAGAAIDESDISGVYYALIKYHRLIPSDKPLQGRACKYIVDSVVPDYISFRTAEHDEDLEKKFDDSDAAMRVQLGVLPGKSKKPRCVLITTLNPGGTKMSEIKFLEFPAKETMVATEDSIDRYYKELGERLQSAYYEPDSLSIEISSLTQEMGLTRPSVVDSIDLFPDRIERENPTKLATGKILKEPTIFDFFNIPSGAKGKEVRENVGMIPFAMISYELSPADMTLTANLNYLPLISYEIAEELKPYYKSGGLKYVWDGKRYQQPRR